MRASMIDKPLLISSLIEHAAKYHGDTEIVSRTVEGPIHRYTWADAHDRAKRMAKLLERLGVRRGDRVGTMAWNGYRHLEAYFAVAGMGAVIHTINPRLFPDQIEYIVNHAEDRFLFIDITFVELVESLIDRLPTVEGVVVLTDAAHMPQSTRIPNLLCYESLLDDEHGDYEWPVLDEHSAAALCYTSGTTGNPKGALYAHRSTIIHTYAEVAPDALGLSARDTILPVVPMFHVNAWGLPYGAAMVGAKLVMPGRALDGESVYELLTSENVTMTAAVPTVWLMLLNHMRKIGGRLDDLERVVIGGSACPRAMMEAFEYEFGVKVLHAWGMTEMSPLGVVNTPKRKFLDLSAEEQMDRGQSAGRPLYGVEMMIVDEQDRPLPWDGETVGELLVRGPWIIQEYFKIGRSDAHRVDGWFATGDVCAIDPDGYIWITDRIKDVIKSGGEWISSIDLENIAVAHPDVAEAAVIGVPHPKWDERPLLVVVRREGATLTREDVLHFFEGRVAKWWLPDDVAFVDELPHTATGKLSKLQLRKRFKGYELPTASQ